MFVYGNIFFLPGLGTRPMKRSGKSKEETFEIGLDGRMIIHEDEMCVENKEEEGLLC